MKQWLVALLLLFVGCQRAGVIAGSDLEGVKVNTTIADLYRMCVGGAVSFNGSLGVVARGTVISCDKEGYISKELYIDDGTATAKVLVGLYNSYCIYPEGVEITIYMPGLSATVENHQLVIGVMNSSGQIRTIDSEVVLDKHILCSSTLNPIAPQLIVPTELDTSMCGKLVTLEQMSYVYTCYEAGDEGEYLRFTDAADNCVYIYIDKYAVGFNDLPPQHPTTITGVAVCRRVPFSEQIETILLPRRRSDIWQ